MARVCSNPRSDEDIIWLIQSAFLRSMHIDHFNTNEEIDVALLFIVNEGQKVI